MRVNSMYLKNGRKITIGLLSENLFEGYQKQVWNGVIERADQLGVNVIIFRGEAFNFQSDQYGYQCNMSIDLLTPDFVDVLIFSGAIFNFAQPEMVAAFLLKHQNIPKVCIAVKMDGIPGVMVDNSTGIIEMVKHLSQVHKKKRIAYISGPTLNPEAGLRLNAYLEGLKVCGMEMDQNSIVYGDFTEISGKEAVRQLFDEKKVSFDAVICANDSMAFGALNELAIRGIRVPEEIAVTGFDNIPDCEYKSPPLTTVSQPTYLQGARALELAVDLVAGKPIPEISLLQTSVKIRRSCGCSGLNTNKISPTLDRKDYLQVLLRKSLTDAGLSGPRYELADSVVQIICKAFINGSFNGNEVDDILTRYEQAFMYFSEIGLDNKFWKKFFEILDLYNDPASGDAGYLIGKLRDTYDRLENITRNVEMGNRVNVDANIRDFARDVIRSLSTKNMLKGIMKWFPLIGLRGCRIYLFEEPKTVFTTDKWMPPDTLLLVLNRDKNRKLFYYKDPGERVPFHDYISIREDNPATKPRHYTIFGLYTNEIRLGYVLFELDYHQINNYEFILMILSSTVINLSLVRQREEMKIAQKIQTLLLPKNITHGELSISAMMKPAAVVGGDYYDVIKASDGTTWIGIGDVTGHGVMAGIIGMMAQTALTTLLNNSPHYDPKLAIIGLNGVLNQNIVERMGENHLMTMLLLKYQGEGNFQMTSAAHPDAMIYRKSTGLFETVVIDKTIFLGLFPAIENELTNNSFVLDEGDTLILYSDGIVEARNKDGEFYDFDRMTECLKNNMTRDLSTIIECVLKDASDWSGNDIKDDMTLVLIRRKSKVHADDSDKLHFELQPCWDIIEEIGAQIETKVHGFDDILSATKMTASELVENAIKYGDFTDGSTIHFDLYQEDGIIVKVANRTLNTRHIDTVRRNIEKISHASDLKELYVKRLQELMDGTQYGESMLGLYRIAYEGAFNLSWTYENGVLTVIAKRPI